MRRGRGGAGGASRPRITGVPGVGNVLTAQVPAGTPVQWRRDGATISGATSVNYMQVSADIGRALSFVATQQQVSGSILVPSSASLSISGTPITTGTVGAPYAGFSVAGAGGTAPYTYSVAAGALPAGLTLNSSTGAVSGTPTTAGTSAGIVLRVTDAAAATANLAAFSIAVAAAGVALSISGSSPTTATVGVAYSGDFDAAGGTAPYTFSIASGTLPAGLALNASTGTISGTPTTAGASAGITVRVTDAASATATSAAFTITVAAAAQDTRPRVFIAPSNAATVNTQALLDGATKFGSNGGKAGSFVVTTTTGNYGWVAVLKSAGLPVFTDVASGFTGGWAGAGASGTDVTDSSGNVWTFFRQDFPNANPTAANWTIA